MNYSESCNIFSDINPGFRPLGFDDEAYDAATGNLSTITSSSGEALAFTYDGSLVTGETMTGPVSGPLSLKKQLRTIPYMISKHFCEPLGVFIPTDSL